MKKEAVVIIIVAIILLAGCAAQESPSDKIIPEEIEPQRENIEQIEEIQPAEVVTEDIVEQAPDMPSAEEPGQSEEEPFPLIYPILTYPNAYNGPLYATSEQIGDSAPMDKHFQNMDRNGVTFMIAFFGIELEFIEEGLLFALQSVRAHPHRIIPFFSPGMGSDETRPLVGERLTTMYKDTLSEIKEKAGQDFIHGFGEIEQYAWDIQPNDPKLLQLYDLAQENNLQVMFHPAVGQSAGVKALIEKYPGTTFLIHMFPEDFDKDRQKYIELLKTHNNLYFSVDVDHMMFEGQTGLLYKFEDESVENAKKKFIAEYDRTEQQLLDSAFQRYKPLIEAVPDKVMWGTEGGTDYVYEPEVYDRMIKFTRLFIGKFKLEVQEKFAYKNALRVFGEGER